MEKNNILIAAGGYFLAVSLLAVILTVSDKLSAKRNGRRVPEKTLLAVGIFGGAAAEYITMKIIRHKTLHGKFMIGLPLIFVLEAAAAATVYLKFFTDFLS